MWRILDMSTSYNNKNKNIKIRIKILNNCILYYRFLKSEEIYKNKSYVIQNIYI